MSMVVLSQSIYVDGCSLPKYLCRWLFSPKVFMSMVVLSQSGSICHIRFVVVLLDEFSISNCLYSLFVFFLAQALLLIHDT